MLGRFLTILTAPFRAIGQLLRGAGRDARASARTAAQAGGAAVASAAAVDLLEEEYKEEPPAGIETVLFTQLPRPRLTERSASELTLEQASEYAQSAKGFYRFGFPLFARGDFFYEEVEQDYLNAALGFDKGSIDRRFLDVSTLFRRTLNANTRRMSLYWIPGVFLVVFGAAFAALFAENGAGVREAAGGLAPAPAVLFGAAALAGALLAFFIFSWPYKVVQQRNLMNLDNYITSKFARINNNFQVAKRRALNVERDKRMSQREELKEEAGAWTLAYHWFAMRLFLCELALRNKFYQVRRNTTLYWAGGVTATLIFAGAMLAVMALQGAPAPWLGAFAAAALLYIVLAGAIMRRASAVMFQVIESHEWSRFDIVGLDATIRDHVGEDKLQIVTFRDRNRIE